MHTFSMRNENDENEDVFFPMELWDILTLLLYGVDVCLLLGLTKHIWYCVCTIHNTIHAIYNWIFGHFCWTVWMCVYFGGWPKPLQPFQRHPTLHKLNFLIKVRRRICYALLIVTMVWAWTGNLVISMVCKYCLHINIMKVLMFLAWSLLPLQISVLRQNKNVNNRWIHGHLDHCHHIKLGHCHHGQLSSRSWSPQPTCSFWVRRRTCLIVIMVLLFPFQSGPRVVRKVQHTQNYV